VIRRSFAEEDHHDQKIAALEAHQPEGWPWFIWKGKYRFVVKPNEFRSTLLLSGSINH
jgi:hypothetical protein